MDLRALVTWVLMAGMLTVVLRTISGWTIAGALVTYLLACYGAIGDWVAQPYLARPLSIRFSFPSTDRPDRSFGRVGSRAW